MIFWKRVWASSLRDENLLRRARASGSFISASRHLPSFFLLLRSPSLPPSFSRSVFREPYNSRCDLLPYNAALNEKKEDEDEAFE